MRVKSHDNVFARHVFAGTKRSVFAGMRAIDLTISGAIFSEDRKYRYALWRVWSPVLPILGCVGLNSSGANEERNDPTIKRGIVRAGRYGFGGFIMTNMHGLVSTDPNALLNNPDAIGELNDYYIKQMVELTKCQICGWGSFKPVKYRETAVYSMLTNPVCLGVNDDGHPKHPLYVSYDTPMVKFVLAGTQKNVEDGGMIMKYVKKPIPTEISEPWLKEGDHPNVKSSIEAPCMRANTLWYNLQADACIRCYKPVSAHGWIGTLEGGHIVCPGDRIVTGVQGEQYPIKPDIFEQTYEPASEIPHSPDIRKGAKE